MSSVSEMTKPPGDFLAPYLKEMTEGPQRFARRGNRSVDAVCASGRRFAKKYFRIYREQANKKYQERGNTVIVSVTLDVAGGISAASQWKWHRASHC